MDMAWKLRNSQANGSSPANIDLSKRCNAGSNVKVLLIAFFNWQGVVYHEFTPNCQTINKEYYLDALRINSLMLHHDNAPTHRSSLVSDFLEKHSTVTVPQPPYSPDPAPADYFPFPKLKKKLKGRRFQMIEDIKKESLGDLKTIPKSAYEKCFQSWTERW